jgi:superfamily II DNA/RNA helicase
MRTWRQLAVSIDRKLVRPRPNAAEEVDCSHDLQAGHSTSTAEQHYGLDASMLRQLTQESMDAMMAVSERWHIFWAMRSRFNSDVQPFGMLTEATAGADHARGMESLKRKLDTMEEQLRSINRKLEQPRSIPAEVRVSTAGVSICRSAALPAPVSKALCKVTRSYRTKTLEQAYSLNAIYAKETPLILVMATGSGKSALFMAPLQWLPPASVIIVVVPFIALTQDLLEQCGRVGITASRWTGYRRADVVQGSELVFVAAENSYHVAFANWAQELEQQKRLAAIFFDECHVCLTQSTFRPAMDKIKALLTAVRVPQYFLTATLPPAMLSAFKSTLNLPQDGTGLIRAATNRPNISYAVHRVTSSAEVQFRLEQLLESYPSGAVMVFCKSRATTQTIAETLGCHWISSDTDDTSKSDTLSAWLRCSATETSNSKRIVVGTTAIGTGINPLHVKLVVHYGDTWDMVSYLQESGRAGRSGGPASAVLLALERSARQEQVQVYVEERKCRRLAISAYMDGMSVTCLSQPDFALCDLCREHVGGPATPRNEVIDLESPPESCRHPRQRGAGEPVAAVRVASASESPTPQTRLHVSTASQLTRQQVTAPARATARQLEQFEPAPPVSGTKALLDSLVDSCSLCFLFRSQHRCGGEHGLAHSFSNCGCWEKIERILPASTEGRINATYIGKLKKRMEKAKNIACFACLAPIKFCQNNSSAVTMRCSRKYADIVLPVVAAVTRSREHCADVFQLLNMDMMEPNTVVTQLGSAVLYKGEKVFLAFAIFAAALETCM